MIKINFDRVKNNAPEAPSLEDPNDSENDVGAGSFNMYRVRQAFYGAFEQLKLALIQSVRDPRANRHPTLLSHIISMDEQMREHRLHVAEAYLKGELHATLDLKRGFTASETMNNGTNGTISTFATTQTSRVSYIDESDEDENFKRMAQQMLRDQGYSDDTNGEVEEYYLNGEITTSAINNNSSADLDDVVKRYSVRTSSVAISRSPSSSDDNSAFDALVENTSRSKRIKTNRNGRYKRFKHKSKGKGRI
jgi:DNA polymerase sigma